MSFTVFTVFRSHLVSFVCNLQEYMQRNELSCLERWRSPGGIRALWKAFLVSQTPRFPTFRSVTCLPHPQRFLREQVPGAGCQAVPCTEGAKFSLSCEGPLPGDWTRGEHSTWPRTANAETVLQGLSEAQRRSHSQC